MNARAFIVPLVLAPALATLAARADDWPMFRGNPTLSGVSSAQLPAALVQKWTFRTGGPVSSSPAVVGDRVFFGSADSNVFCVRLADGARQWAFRAGGPIEASPLVLDGRLYIGDVNTNFYCLDAATGREVWRQGFEDKTKSSANWYAGPDGRKRIVVGCYDFKLYSLDALTGKTNWVYETGNYINGSPAIADGRTAFGGCDAVVHVVSLADGKKTAEIEAGAYIIGSAALLDGKAFVGQYENEFLCIDLRAGKVLWRYRDRAFPYAASPAVTADRVLFGGRDKRLHCVKRDTGEAVWVFPTRGKVESSPVVVGDKVVFGSDDGRLYLIALADGRELWQRDLGQPVQSSPAVVEGHVVVGCDDGNIYCFGSK